MRKKFGYNSITRQDTHLKTGTQELNGVDGRKRNCHEMKSLCAGKQYFTVCRVVCRVFFIGYTANRCFVVCQETALGNYAAHGKTLFDMCQNAKMRNWGRVTEAGAVGAGGAEVGAGATAVGGWGAEVGAAGVVGADRRWL